MNELSPFRHDLTHTIMSVLFIGLLIGLTFWILFPFFVSMVWGTIFVVATWPVMQGLQRRLGNRRGLAVCVMATVLLLMVLAPLLFAILTIAKNAESITTQAKSLNTFSLPSPPEWIESIPLAGKAIADKWKSISELSPEERSAFVIPYAQQGLKWLLAGAGGTGRTILQVLLTMVISIILYAKGEVFREGILAFARRLAGQKGEEVAILAGKAIRGVVMGVALTALVQATVAGIGLFATGVPAAGLLTAVVLILCLAQLGPLLVMIPAVIWLYWTGQSGLGTVLLVFSILSGTIDNVLRPVLIKKGVDLPLLLIFAGVIGGLFAFGFIGLFIAPVILAVSYTLLSEWVSDDREEDRGVSRA